MTKRIINLRNIGFRLFDPQRGLSHLVTQENPTGGIQWASCSLQVKKPEKPKGPEKPQPVVFMYATTLLKPNYTRFSDPCK